MDTTTSTLFRKVKTAEDYGALFVNGKKLGKGQFGTVLEVCQKDEPKVAVAAVKHVDLMNESKKTQHNARQEVRNFSGYLEEKMLLYFC